MFVISKILVNKRMYNDNFTEENIVIWDVIPIKSHQKIKVIFEEVYQTLPQGVRLSTNGKIVCGDSNAGGIRLWFDNKHPEIECECFSKDGLLSVYNIWEEQGSVLSQMDFSGMLIEETDHGIRYRCNNNDSEGNFNKLIFRIELI